MSKEPDTVFPSQEEIESVFSEITESSHIGHKDKDEDGACDMCRFAEHLDGLSTREGKVSKLDYILVRIAADTPIGALVLMTGTQDVLLYLLRFSFLLGHMTGRREGLKAALDNLITKE